jgi:serine/threonine protein kinase/Tfp pilus assembly protein PilF
MGMRCPKCQFDNPSDSKYCKECGTPLPSEEGISISSTKTLQMPAKDLIKGITFAGRYQLIDELGRGGMGVVYKAQDIKLKRTVALKFLPSELTHIPEVKERFMREAQAAAALDHPHICTVYEFDEAEEKPFISMAYVEGQSLKKKIDFGPLEMDEALKIATQAAEGLQEAHKKGVIHRDIKSANIMVTEKGQAKIMDFGLARIREGTLVTKEGMTMGTIAYMSPEQARGEEIDHRTDIWSLGVVLYEMLSSQLPFRGEHDQAVLFSILNEKPRPVTDFRAEIPVALEQVVGKALEKNPDKRYQHMEELLDDLKSITEGVVPEGLKASLRKAKLLRRKKAILYLGLACFLIIMTVIALSLFTGHVKTIDSIAVLPFENLSGDPEQEYFVEGMHEELITELSKISALKVISRPSVMRYRNSEKPLPEIAKELNVEGIIAGSALKEGGRVRISVQLIEAETERNLWAEKYEKDYHDILMLHGEVALNIAEEIRIAVTTAEQTRLASERPVNSEAHELYLKGRYYWNRFSPEWTERAISYYKQAVEKDPTYALPYTGLAEVYVLLSIGFAVLPTRDNVPQARKAALKALEIDPTLAEAYVSLGLIAACYDWDRQAAKKHFERALELNPNSVNAHRWIEIYLALLEGEYHQAITHLERAQELDPLDLHVKARLGWNYWYLRDFDRAVEQFKVVIDFDPNNQLGYLGLRDVYSLKGMYDKSIEEGEKALNLGMRSDAVIGGLGSIYGFAGKKDKALELLSELEARSREGYVSSFQVAAIYWGLGEMDIAFEWMEKAYEERDGNLIYITVPLVFDALSPDPRYKQFLKKMGLEHLFEKLSFLKKKKMT